MEERKNEAIMTIKAMLDLLYGSDCIPSVANKDDVIAKAYGILLQELDKLKDLSSR